MRRKHTQSRRRKVNTERRRRSVMMRPSVQIGILLFAALVIFIILQSASGDANSLPASVNVDTAYSMYNEGAFVLDVRTVEEWNEYHAPDTTLIPLDQLASRVNELPRDRDIVIVCRSGNRSQEGRDILLNAGFERVTSMTGGLIEWRARGYLIEP
jgi:rhodanese-related sulfurtransferase